MAYKLPLREDFENWTTYQVSDLLKQCGLQECTGVVGKMGMTGHTFLNMTDYELNKFSILYQPQIQKMVHDLKNNEGGIMQKFKRFQNDQVALFCRTGKDAWDRITNKPPPSVPRRDYVAGPQDEETDEWSDESAKSRIANTKHPYTFGCQKSGLPHRNLDCRGGSDYENPNCHSDEETYVVPTEEQDESYEPPPNEQEPRFTPSYRFTDRNGGYADRNQAPASTPNEPRNRPTRPLPKPNESTLHQVSHLPPPSRSVPKALPKPAVVTRQLPISVLPPVRKKSQPQHDDQDYVVPGDEEEDDNYIEPTASPEPYRPPIVIRTNKPGQSSITRSSKHTEEPDHYEVPENEAKPSPPAREAKPVPRRKSPPKQEPRITGDNFEDTDRRPEPPMKPAPHPRKPKPGPTSPRTPGFLPRDLNSNIEKPAVLERQRIQSIESDVPPTPPSRQSLPEIASRYVVNHSRHGSVVEQDAGVLNKDWYSSSCDRKAAEEALQAACKDGAFLVRRSTGQDQKQPFTLVVFYKKRVYNIPVRFIESTKQYALGREKSGEEKFNSIAEMIENHQRSSLVLIDSQTNTKDLTRLMHAVKVP
ncbi:B-cell linker protein isoform X2 [Rana temporaria]|uniref:B-cell linker protein isoform X2 n=1 Tax=Rana temporaria TaxID=8407 RepID=UPI001AADB139|nr:B-cell linker protein isoform X2 [Rana temporaria]